jgi:hypothetical protein
MEKDEASLSEVHEQSTRQLAERERQQRASMELQRAGTSALAELQKAGLSSESVARAIGKPSSTVRKLGLAEDSWRPLSRQTYAALDAFTQRRLARSWNLAALRDAFDEAHGVSAERTIVALDIEGFGRSDRDDQARVRLREAMFTILNETLFDTAADPRDRSAASVEDTGDGLFAVIGPEIPTIHVLQSLLRRLPSALHLYNQRASAIARLRLRVAVHVGAVIPVGSGSTGDALNLTARLLDSSAVRHRLQETTGPLVVVISDTVYHRTVGSLDVDPRAFTRISVRVKETATNAWAWTDTSEPVRRPSPQDDVGGPAAGSIGPPNLPAQPQRPSPFGATAPPWSPTPPSPAGTMTPGLASDTWTVGDELGYAPYARAIAEFIQHPDTQPPCTIGIKGPWGMGKTSLMRMVQNLLDSQPPTAAGHRPAHERRPILLTETARRQVSAGNGWWQRMRRIIGGWKPLGQVTNRTIQRKLAERQPPQSGAAPLAGDPSAHSGPATQPAGPAGAAGWRPTVWFNPWTYQTGDQVWAGLAHEVITQLTGRMRPAEREHFWLSLHLRRVDRDAARRKLYRALTERLLPVVGVVAGLLMVGIGSLLLRPLLDELRAGLETVGRGALTLGPLGAVAWGIWRATRFFGERVGGPLAGLIREPDYRAGWSRLLGEEAKGMHAELVRDPGYDQRLGLLYLVQTDMQRVLDLVATPERPVVIFIDDLDRCNPGTVVQVVEAINLFLSGQFPNCVFVIAMEPELVAAHIEVAYAQLGQALRGTDYWGENGMLGWRFLDKIIQLPVTLPPVDPGSVARFTETTLAGVAQPTGTSTSHDVRVEPAVTSAATDVSAEGSTIATTVAVGPESAGLAAALQEADRYTLAQRLRDNGAELVAIVRAAAASLANNPRAIKRFVNVFRLYAVVAQERRLVGLPAPQSFQEFAKLAILAVRWPWLRAALARQIGAGQSDTLLALLEQPIDGLDEHADWPARKEALAKVLESSHVPEDLQSDLLSHPELCLFLSGEPKVGDAIIGFL